jgi:hypothetical protein
MHQSFHRELAHDRQRQLVRDDRMAAQLAELRAHESSEREAERRQARRFEPRHESVLAMVARRVRSALHVRPLGA